MSPAPARGQRSDEGIICNSCSAMSAKKKDFEERVVIFKKEPGQSKENAWLYFDTKVTGAANNLHTDQAPFIFEQFDDKLPDWGLK